MDYKDKTQTLKPCPNAYEGEGMYCCRCVKPQYPKPQPESWEERFDQEFNAESIWVVPSDYNIETIREIQQFIAQELQRAREDALEACRVEMRNHGDFKVKWCEGDRCEDCSWNRCTTQYDENVKKFLGKKKS